jgi:hypothetical protein
MKKQFMAFALASALTSGLVPMHSQAEVVAGSVVGTSAVLSTTLMGICALMGQTFSSCLLNKKMYDVQPLALTHVPGEELNPLLQSVAEELQASLLDAGVKASIEEVVEAIAAL